MLAAPLDGSGPVVVIATGGSQTWDVKVQDGFVYYGNQARATLDGSSGGVELGRLPFGSCPQGNIIVRNGAVYWTDTCSQAVHRYVIQ